MTRPTLYSIDIEDEEHLITITPHIKTIPGGDKYLTGVYRLTEGTANMGDIVFDDDMNEWEYTGMGDLTHDEAEQVADYIKQYQEPAGEEL